MQTPKIDNPRFFEMLKARRIVPEGFIRDLLEELKGNALDVLTTLIQSGAGGKRQLCQLWCDSIGIAHVDLEKSLFQPHVVHRLPERFARLHYAIPLYQMGDIVTVATPVPDNPHLAKEIEAIIGSPVNLVFALPVDVEWAIDKEYHTNTALLEFLAKIAASRLLQEHTAITEQALQTIAGPGALQQLHICLMLQAIAENASEIRFTPEGAVVKVYMRAHREINHRLTLDRGVYETMLPLVRAMAKTAAPSATDETRHSRILLPAPGRKFDVRVTELADPQGNLLVFKFMDPAPLPSIPPLNTLYFSSAHLAFLGEVMKARTGVVLAASPQWDDSTELGYSLLMERQLTKGGKIMTVEDSIRWLFKDIEQHQVNEKANYFRRDAVAACLKSQPDALFVHHLDDPEILELVREAAGRGQFIIGCVQSQDVYEAFDNSRVALGPFISAIVHRRKVRRLCDHCKEKYRLPLAEAESWMDLDTEASVYAWRPIGCSYCRHTGFSGHVGIHELWGITPEMREWINAGASMKDIRAKNRAAGFKDHQHDGLKKALRGLTAFSEIAAISPEAAKT